MNKNSKSLSIRFVKRFFDYDFKIDHKIRLFELFENFCSRDQTCIEKKSHKSIMHSKCKTNFKMQSLFKIRIIHNEIFFENYEY